MPRIVDHDQRRAELARAAMRLVRERGVGALSVRNLAQESGWSAGAVRHYLPAHRDIIELVAGRVRSGFEQRLMAVPVQQDPAAHLRGLLGAALPLDAESRELSQVWFAFMGSEVHDAQGVGALVYDELAALLTDYFTGCQERGFLRVSSARQATVALQAAFDGLTVHLLLGRVDGDEAMAALDHLLAQLLAPSLNAPRVVPR